MPTPAPSFLHQLLVEQVDGRWKKAFNKANQNHPIANGAVPRCGWIASWSRDHWVSSDETPTQVVLGENPGRLRGPVGLQAQEQRLWNSCWSELAEKENPGPWNDRFQNLARTDEQYFQRICNQNHYANLRDFHGATLFFNVFPYDYPDHFPKHTTAGRVEIGRHFAGPLVNWLREKLGIALPHQNLWLLGDESTFLMGSGLGRMTRHPANRAARN